MTGTIQTPGAGDATGAGAGGGPSAPRRQASKFDMSGWLDGRVAFVTGAGSGIGADIARRMAHAGAAVAVVDRNGDAAAATAASIEADGGRACAVVADLSVASERRFALDEAVSKLGNVDVLVNNAADHGTRHDFLEVDDEEWDRVLATNLTATAMLCQAVAASMAQRRNESGVIINLAAIQVSLPLPTYVSYAATKGGIVSLTKALAVELGPLGIRVNAVAPGAVASGSTRVAMATAGNPDGASPTLLGRMGTGDDVASVCVFLASQAASFVTGAVVVVDGGRSLSRQADPLSDLSRPRPHRSSGG